jgi:hypothetical protein
MRAKAPTPAGQPVQIVGSPAESITTPGGTIDNDVVVMPNNPAVDPSPITLIDEQVFLRPSAPLTIAGLGDGEFTNFANPLDVDRSGTVAPTDAVLIINKLNSGGAGSLSPLAYETSGFVRPTNLLDVSMDSVLAPLDAVLVINYLNAKSALLASGQPAAAAVPVVGGEGESEALAEGASATDDALLAAMLLTEDESAPAAPPVSATSSAPDEQVLQTTATGSTSEASSTTGTPLVSSRSGKVEPEAADELFASLASSQATELSLLHRLSSRFNLKNGLLR